MKETDWSREPISSEVNGCTHHFYCRLFADQQAARRVYRPLVDWITGSSASLLLVREPEEEWTWGVMLLSTNKLEILAFSPCIHDFGRPYRSRYLYDAVCHLQGVRAGLDTKSGSRIASGVLERLDPDKLH